MTGRYELFGPIAAGGMATVHFGRLRGEAGFHRIVAIKRLHREYAEVPETVASLIDEARIVSRVRHPNVVQTLDVYQDGGELFLVMEYVAGESLAHILEGGVTRGHRLPPGVTCTIIAQVLHGLHAAHVAVNEIGEPLGIVHRDVSPQNVLVGQDGLARLVDFGIAKARSRLQQTRAGELKGKLAYMAPEQILDGEVGPQTDVFAAAAVLWEALTARRLFFGDHAGHVIHRILHVPAPPPSAIGAPSSAALDAVVLRGLERDPSRRFPSALAFATALERVEAPVAATEIAAWVMQTVGDRVRARAERVAEIERGVASSAAVPSSRRRSEPAPPAGPDEPTRDDAADAVVASAPMPLAQPAAPPRARWPFAVGAVIGFVALVVGVTLARSMAAPGPAGGPANPPSGDEGAARALPPVEPAPTTSPNAAIANGVPTATEPSAPSAESTAAPKVTTSTPPRARGAHTTPAEHAAPRPRAPAPDCNPPFTVDAEGIQHLKPECAR